MTGHYNPNSKLDKQKSYINGRYVDNLSGETFETRFPGTNEVICVVEIAAQNEVNEAVESAKNAFKIWSRMPASERSKILYKAGEILLQRNTELAELETLDTGKAIAETSTVDIITGVDVLHYYAGIAPSIQGQHIDLPPNAFATVRREPLGVCAGIGAWNYPIQIALWKSSVALACGNTMVFKPAEQTPLTALKLAEIYTEAGLPDGVFNVVQGFAETGATLCQHPDVAKVSLTGSVETGKKVMASAAESLKKVTLELGGKSPIIIFNDADFESALNAALVANFYSTGQVCSNGTRVFVERSIYQDFCQRLVERTANMKVGNPFDPEAEVGPLVSSEHYEKVTSYMRDAKQSGATHLVGGDIFEHGDLANGNYITPAVFSDCTDDMAFVNEEVFGPLMAVLPFDDEQEAIERANNTTFGLAGAVFTRDFAKAHRVANAIEAGAVWINDYNITPAEAPFGGYKQSGLGRENGLSGIEQYTQLKTIYSNLGSVEALY